MVDDENNLTFLDSAILVVVLMVILLLQHRCVTTIVRTSMCRGDLLLVAFSL